MTDKTPEYRLVSPGAFENIGKYERKRRVLRRPIVLVSAVDLSAIRAEWVEIADVKVGPDGPSFKSQVPKIAEAVREAQTPNGRYLWLESRCVPTQRRVVEIRDEETGELLEILDGPVTRFRVDARQSAYARSLNGRA